MALVEAAPLRGVNLPTLITVARIVAVPVIAALVLVKDTPAAAIAALAVFILAAVSDYFDGWLARAWNQQSELGRMLDPIADKLLVGIVLMLLVANGTLAGWALVAALIILAREILVSGLREYLAGLTVKVLVTQLAKWKTALQLVALGVLLAAPVVGGSLPQLHALGIALLWAAALLTSYTGYAYLTAALKHSTSAKV
jgi:cardiolipin synthase (CMP-forming)